MVKYNVLDQNAEKLIKNLKIGILILGILASGLGIGYIWAIPKPDYCGLTIGVSKSFYVTTTDHPNYRNRTYDVLGIGIFGIGIDKDVYNKMYNYLKNNNCLNLSDNEEIINAIGEDGMISGWFEIMFATSLIIFDEPTETIEGKSKQIIMSYTFLPIFYIWMVDQNANEISLSVSFQSINDFYELMDNDDIICFEDLSNLDIIKDPFNSLIINSVYLNTTSTWDSVVKATFNGKSINLVRSSGML